MKKNKVAFYTLGCKVNQYETNVIEAMFKNDGFEVVDFTEFADVYIVNTCTVTSMSDKKSRQILRRAKQINPDSILCAMGCYAQVGKAELEKIDDIDIILGNNEKKDILNIVKDRMHNGDTKVEHVEDIMKLAPYCEFDSISTINHVRAEIKIQDGCDRFCSYCIIPYARGPVRSRKKENVLSEIKNLALKGIKEVVLTGIHISSYGKDFENNIISTDEPYNYKYGLADLVGDICEIEGIERVRLGSIEPRIITEEFVKKIDASGKVCNHFHLSLQSGCDDTLKRMNRLYTTSQYKNSVDIIRKYIKEAAITTDVIVGFPGETDEEFRKTVEFLKDIHFSKLHVFKYSRRKGTKAYSMDNQVSEEVKEERSRELIKLSDEWEEEFAKQYIGKEIDVLFENDKEGHTSNYIKAVLKNPNKEFANKIIKIKPKFYEKDSLICE